MIHDLWNWIRDIQVRGQRSDRACRNQINHINILNENLCSRVKNASLFKSPDVIPDMFSCCCFFSDDGKLSFDEFKAYFSDGVLTADELKELFHTIDTHNTE